MTSSTEPRQHMSSMTTGEELTPIAVEIHKVRSLFLAYLSTLPSPFDELAKRHYLDRLVRAGDRHMLGEYAPFLLADVLQIPSASPSDIILPWLVLYEQVLVVDDVIDVNGDLWAQEILLSQVLFDEFMSLWRNKFYKHPSLWQAFSKYHKEGALAALKEVERSAQQSVFPITMGADWLSENHLSNGRKAALVKFCASALSIEHNGRPLTVNEEQGIDKLCAGIQLLDDLTDSIEDHLEGRDTYPLREGLLWLYGRPDLSAVHQRTLDEDEITFVLIASKAAIKVAQLSQTYLSSGVADLHIKRDSPTGNYLISLIENSSRCAESLNCILDSNSDQIERMTRSLNEGTQSFRRLTADPSYKTIWEEMEINFKSIPTASN